MSDSQYIEAMIAFENDQLGKPYKFGARGPNAYDCMGLQWAGARAAGLDSTVFPNSWTVRNITGWARDRGYLHLATSDYEPKRGDLGLWGPVDGGQPVKGAGHILLVKRPPSAARPMGKAISAYNTKYGVINHGVLPKPGGHLALYGFIALPYPAPEPVPAEIEDVDAPSDAVEIVAPTVEELQAKITAAQQALA